MPIRQQSSEPQDRCDTRYYADDEDRGGPIADLANDLSQYEASMTVGAGADVVYELASDRCSIGSPRTVAIQFFTEFGLDFVLWQHGTGAGLERVTISAAGVLTWTWNNTTIATVSGLNLGETDWIIAIATEPNPAATGGANALRSYIYILSGGTPARTLVTHEAKVGGTGDWLWFARATTGTDSLYDTGQAYRVRFSSRFCSFTEILQDWDGLGSSVTNKVAKLVRQGLPLTKGSGIGDVGEFHGAAIQHPAAELGHLQWRTMGAPLNWHVVNSPLLDTDHTHASHREKIRIAPGGQVLGYRLRLGWFGVFPIHPNANALWVEVFAQCLNVTDADLRQFGLRIYSMNKPPVVAPVFQGQPGEASDPFEYRVREVTFTADEDALGSYRVQAVLPVVVGESGIRTGKTYVGLAYAMDMLDAGSETFRVRVRALHGVEMYDTTAGLPPHGGPAGEAG